MLRLLAALPLLFGTALMALPADPPAANKDAELEKMMREKTITHKL